VKKKMHSEIVCWVECGAVLSGLFRLPTPSAKTPQNSTPHIASKIQAREASSKLQANNKPLSKFNQKPKHQDGALAETGCIQRNDLL
jgi:hypothetical protein